MSSIFDNELNLSEQSKPVEEVSQEVVDETTTDNPVLEKNLDEMVEQMKNYDTNSPEPLVFENIEPEEYNYLFFKFNKCHFKPVYCHEKRTVSYPR